MKSKSFSRSAQKGFYIALSLCVAAIFVTAYVVTSNRGQENAVTEQNTQSVANEPQTPVFPTETPVSTPRATTPVTSAEPVRSANTKPREEVQSAATEPTGIAMPAEGELAVAHSDDVLVYSKTYEDWRIHNGIDINCEKGTAVKAVANGTVEKVYTDPLKGIVIEISHGNMRSVYANLSTDSMVQVGTEVKAGDIISGVGDSGTFESGQQPHLHFELYQDNAAVDPTDWFSAES